MVWAFSKRTAGTRETEVMQDGWCKGALGQQIRERSEREESPGTYVTE